MVRALRVVGAALIAMTVASAGSVSAQGRDDPGVVIETTQLSGALRVRAVAPALGTRWAVFGQSQGGRTALFTAALGPADAPELALRGAVATGAPSNLEYGVTVVGPWVPRLPLRKSTTYFGLILAGLRATAPELDIDSYLTPIGEQVLRIVETECVNDADALVHDIAIGQMLRRQLAGPALESAVRSMLRIPTEAQTVPLFLGQGLTDMEVPAPLSVKLIADLRSSGADLQVGVYPGDHLSAAADALPDALAFLHRVLA